MKTALILIDVQHDNFVPDERPVSRSMVAATRAASLLDRFRRHGDAIVHIRHVSTRPGVTTFLEGAKGAEIHELVRPWKGETVLVKHVPSSFSGTGLDEHLKNLGIGRLVVAGMMTHMCIDTTVRAAKDLGYEVVLVGDACATKNLEFEGRTVLADDVQAAYLAALGYYFARVVTTKEALAEVVPD